MKHLLKVSLAAMCFAVVLLIAAVFLWPDWEPVAAKKEPATDAEQEPATDAETHDYTDQQKEVTVASQNNTIVHDVKNIT